MKILYYVPDLGVCNGVASYSMNYYEKLKDKIKFDFLVTNDVDSPYYKKIKADGNNVYFMPKTKNIFKINSFLNNLFSIEKYDILHCHVINRGAVVLKMAKKNGVNIRILHSHTTQNGDTFIKKVIRFPFKEAALKYSNICFACSKMAGDYLFGKRDYIIINNAVSLKSDSLLKEKNKSFTFGTVGRFTLQKNPFFILEILNKLKKTNFNFRFLWIGSGELLDVIKRKASKLGVYDNIVFVGNTTDVSSYYRKMDLFILPSLYEGLPVVGIEAQVIGIPCLFSNRITDEIVINENVKLLDIDCSDYWVKEIIDKSKNEINQKAFVNKAREKYDIDLNANLLFDIYQKLLK